MLVPVLQCPCSFNFLFLPVSCSRFSHFFKRFCPSFSLPAFYGFEAYGFSPPLPPMSTVRDGNPSEGVCASDFFPLLFSLGLFLHLGNLLCRSAKSFCRLQTRESPAPSLHFFLLYKIPSPYVQVDVFLLPPPLSRTLSLHLSLSDRPGIPGAMFSSQPPHSPRRLYRRGVRPTFDPTDLRWAHTHLNNYVVHRENFPLSPADPPAFGVRFLPPPSPLSVSEWGFFGYASFLTII